MNKEELINLIQKKYPETYTNKESLEVLVDSLLSLDAELFDVLERILNDEQYEDVSAGGYTLARLSQEHGMNELAALVTLDWLKRDPEKALKSLEKGHDFVV